MPAALSGLKAVTTESGDVRFVAYGQSYANGTAYNEKLATNPRSSARIYDSIYVRHWDTWITTKFNSVFSGNLKAHGKGASQYALKGSIQNLVSNIKNAESPYPPYGDATDYDLSPDGKWVAFKSKAPDVPRANFTTSYIYLAPHDGSQKAFAINGRDSPAKPDGIDGDSSYPAFSPDSKKLAYFQMKGNSYESDRRILYVYHIGSNKTVQTIAKNWDRSPEAVEWTADGKELVVNGEDYARSRLFSLPADAGNDFKPKNFTDGGAVSAYYQLPDSTWLVTDTTLWSSWNVYIASPSEGVIKTLASASQIDPELKGLSASDIDEFYYKGNWTDVSLLILFGPLLTLTDIVRSIPGSSTPQASTRAKPIPFYSISTAVLNLPGRTPGVPDGMPKSLRTRDMSLWHQTQLAAPVLARNLQTLFKTTGVCSVLPWLSSISLDQALTAVIGGSPYDDLVKCWEYARDNLSFVDTENGVAAGASYGAFMINWIQGNPLGREFKALVSHDGPFFGDSRYNTDELWFVQHDVCISHLQHPHFLWLPSFKIWLTIEEQWYNLGKPRELLPLRHIRCRAHPSIFHADAGYP